MEPNPSPPATKSLISRADLHEALAHRFESGKEFPDRPNYVGASEVGYCIRSVVHRKVEDEKITDPAAMGRMNAGRVMEGEVVAMVRYLFDRQLERTGYRQVELVDPDSPLRAHPDGLFRPFVAQDGPWVTLSIDGKLVTIDALPGPGVLEIKSAGGHLVRAWSRRGITNLAYPDQAQVQMGLSGRLWCILVVVSREDLSQATPFFVPFDENRFRELQQRARVIMGHAAAARAAIANGEDPLPHYPAGEPDRGYCSSCPIADTCPAVTIQKIADGKVPPDVELELEVLREEYLAAKPYADDWERIKKAIRERLVACGAIPWRDFKPSYRPGRMGYDLDALRRDHPGVLEKYEDPGDPYYQLDFRPAGGAPKKKGGAK